MEEYNILHDGQNIRAIVTGSMVRIVTKDRTYNIFDDQFNDNVNSHVRSLAFATMPLYRIISILYITYKIPQLERARNVSQRFMEHIYK